MPAPQVDSATLAAWDEEAAHWLAVADAAACADGGPDGAVFGDDGEGFSFMELGIEMNRRPIDRRAADDINARRRAFGVKAQGTEHIPG